MNGYKKTSQTMNAVIDIGNSRLKCGFLLPNGKTTTHSLPIPPNEKQFDKLTATYPEPITWRIAPTGSFHWKECKATILRARPHDKFQIVTRRHIPLNIDAHNPQKIGVDRLLAALAATEKYGITPMLVVDAGSAITVDVVQNRTFCGGAILPGLGALSQSYPNISVRLPLVPIADSLLNNRPVYPGKNTKEAIRNGIYWGTIGAILQLYNLFCVQQKTEVRLILTGGDAHSILPGLSLVLPAQQITHCDTLVLEGINFCFDERQKR